MENVCCYDLGTLILAFVAVLFALAHLGHILRRGMLLIRRSTKHTLTITEKDGEWLVDPPKINVKVLDKVGVNVQGACDSAKLYFPQRIFGKTVIDVKKGVPFVDAVKLLAPSGMSPYYVEIIENGRVIAIAKGGTPPEIEVDPM